MISKRGHLPNGGQSVLLGLGCPVEERKAAAKFRPIRRHRTLTAGPRARRSEAAGEPRLALHPLVVGVEEGSGAGHGDFDRVQLVHVHHRQLGADHCVFGGEVGHQ